MPYFIVEQTDGTVQWIKADYYEHTVQQGNLDVPTGYAGPLGGAVHFHIKKKINQPPESLLPPDGDAETVMSLAPGSWKAIRKARPGWEEEQYHALTAPMTAICTCYHMRADHDEEGNCLVCQECKGFRPAPQAMQDQWVTIWKAEIEQKAKEEFERQQEQPNKDN